MSSLEKYTFDLCLEENRCTVTLGGTLDETVGERLEEEVNGAIQQGTSHFFFRVEGVEMVSIRAMRSVYKVLETLHLYQVSYEFSSWSSLMEEVLEIFGLNPSFARK